MRPVVGGWWLEVLGLLALAVILAGITFRVNPPQPVVPEVGPPAGELIPAGIDEVMALHDAGALFIDVRPVEAFNQGRLPDAVSFPPQGKAQTPAPPAGRPVVVYGQGPELEAALVVGRRLVADGFSPVYIFVEGLEGWLAAGGSLEGSGEE